MTSRNKRGFTLIELLVVIAIIAILAAILFPVFAQAREKARQTTCGSNIKQIGLAVMQYQQDYDEMMPPTIVDPTDASYCGGQPGASCRSTWIGLCYPYMKTMDIWKCPDMIDAIGSTGDIWQHTGSTLGSTPWRNTSIWEGYGLNVDYMELADPSCTTIATAANPNSGPPISIARINKPAETVMITGSGIAKPNDESAGFNPQLYQVNGGYYTVASPASYNAPDECSWSDEGWGTDGTWGPYGGFEQPRHGQGGQVLFADGHAKFMTAGALAAGTDWSPNSTVETVHITDVNKYLWDLN